MKALAEIESYVKKKMTSEQTAHDWFHVERVVKSALFIAKKEKKGNLFIIHAAALLHDISDWKVNNSGKSEEQVLEETYKSLAIPLDNRKVLSEIILNMSFNKNIERRKKLSIEGQIVQDADRLDALGAIGIARAFAYGGKKNRLLYDPSIKPITSLTQESYKKSDGHTVNHFYEKLFKLRKQLNTKTAKEIADKREQFMKAFLKEFYAEWQGKPK